MNDTELPEIYDFLLKFILIGDSGVGKSSLMYHFLNNRSRNPSPHTIGVEFSSTLLRLPSSTPTAAGSSRFSSSSLAKRETTLKLQIYDTAGSERFRSVTRNYYRGTCGAVICYDITSRASFASLGAWLTDVRQLASKDVSIVVVGNKLDEDEHRQVSFLEGSRWAKEQNVLFMETSSISGENVEQPFILLARSILLAIESGQLDPEKPGSGVHFGERSLRRVSSWGSGGKNTRGLNLKLSRVTGGKCC